MTNEKLYQRNKETQWSQTIETRRLHWLGHLLRLPESTRAQKSFQEFQQRSEKPKHASLPKTTWVKTITQDLKTKDLTLNQAKTLSLDRKVWQTEMNKG